ncbi:hypothetical protein HGB25_02770 [Candidatus Saccharibacteria bacterium]|nr:hypothetical protein [Candidatus Saccharibacteria bacterium]
MFPRRNGSESSPVEKNQVITNPHSCPDGECDIVNGGESVDSAEHAIRSVSDLMEEVDVCYRVIEVSVSSLHALRDEIFEYYDDVSANRGTKRKVQRNRNAIVEDLKQPVMPNIYAYMEEHHGKDWRTSPATETNMGNLGLSCLKLIKNMAAKVIIQSSDDFTPDHVEAFQYYRDATIAELMARTSLAMFQIAEPELMHSLMQPEVLRDLPDSFKKLIASDIHMGERGSVVLQGQSRYIDEQAKTQNDGQQVLDYMECSHLTSESRLFFQGLSMGAVATGATICPSNEFGICKRVIEKVTIPEEVQKDIDRKNQSKKREHLQALRHFASQIGPDPLGLDFKAVNKPTKEHETAKSRKRGHKKNHASPIQNDTADVATEATPTFSKVSAKIGKLHVELDPSNSDSIKNAVETIATSDMFTDYMMKYRDGGKVEEFIRHAIETILFSPSYNTEVSIEKIVSEKPFYVDGKRTRLHRLSGRHLIGGSGGSSGRNTRIFFAPHGEGSERTVIFTGVLHKSEFAKRSVPRHVALAN